MATKKVNQKEMRKHFVETLYDTLEGVVSPTPYLEMGTQKVKDASGNEKEIVDVRFLNGKGRLPTPNSTEVTVLDIDIASMFFDDFHVLYEGVTGVGKTYTSDALFNTVFGPEGNYTLRLSGGVFGSSALEPFTTTTLENGVHKTRIDHKKCQQYGALFIDEINRGDSQEVFLIVDGKIHVNEDTGYLRIPIKKLKQDFDTWDKIKSFIGKDIYTGRHKGLVIIAAMNPADAEHNAALELDIAGENRFLKFRFPNGVAEAGSSQLEKNLAGDLHEKFWGEFSKRSGMKGGWKEVYPIVTDPAQFPSELDGETKEFIDTAVGYVGYDPQETFERNVELMQQGGLSPNFAIDTNHNDYKKIRDAQGTLKHGFVRRDLGKIRDLSRLLGFIKGIKDGSYDANVRLNDVAAGIGVVLESKAITGTDPGSLMVLVNDARSAYSSTRKLLDKLQGNGIMEVGEKPVPEGYGIREFIFHSALYLGQEKGFDAYLNTLRAGMEQLNTQAGSASQATIRSRVLADLAVLEHFSKTYESDVTAALKAKGADTFKGFSELYQAKKAEASVYEHRLGSIVG